MKAQVLADFVAEMTPKAEDNDLWILHVNGSSNPKGSGANLILESSSGVMVEVSLTFRFTTSNNQAEYETRIPGLLLARDFSVKHCELLSDSVLVVSQIKNQYEAKDPTLQKYLSRVKELLSLFQRVEVKHVPRAENSRADALPKLASTKAPGNQRSVI